MNREKRSNKFCIRTLSVLGHWTSLFAEIEFLPALVFPFVKQFQNNQLILFEIVATILCKCLKNFNKCIFSVTDCFLTSQLVFPMVSILS
jgi:hypothetical protein